MKSLLALALILLQFSTLSMEVFYKSSKSSVHEGNAETVALMTSGDKYLEVLHEDPETGHGCTFSGVKLSEGIYQDQDVSQCKISFKNAINGTFTVRTLSGSNCASVCGASAELKKISGLNYQTRE